MILPVLEVQAGAQVGAKQGVSAASGNDETSFSTAFGESLRDSAQTAPGSAAAANGAAVGTAIDGRAAGLQAAKLGATGPLSNAKISLVEADNATAGVGPGTGPSAGFSKGSAGLFATAPGTLVAMQALAAKASKTSVGISAGVSGDAKAIAGKGNLVEAEETIEDAAGGVVAKADDASIIFENATATDVPVNGNLNAPAVAATVLKGASSGGTTGGISLPAGLVGKITEPFAPVKLEGATASKPTNPIGKSASVKGAAGLGGSGGVVVAAGTVASELLVAPGNLGSAVQGVEAVPAATARTGLAGEGKQAASTGSAVTGAVPAPIAAGAGGSTVRVTEVATNGVAAASFASEIQTAANVLDGATAAGLTAVGARATALNTDVRAAASQSQAQGEAQSQARSQAGGPSGGAAPSRATPALQDAVAAGGANVPGSGFRPGTSSGAIPEIATGDGSVKTGQSVVTDQAQATGAATDTSTGTKLDGDAGFFAASLTGQTRSVETHLAPSLSPTAVGAQVVSAASAPIPAAQNLVAQNLVAQNLVAQNLVAKNLVAKNQLAENLVARNVVLPGTAQKNLIAQSTGAHGASLVSGSGTLTASGSPQRAAASSQTTSSEAVKTAAVEQPVQAGTRQPQQGIAGQSSAGQSTRPAGSREGSTASGTGGIPAANEHGAANAGANSPAAVSSVSVPVHDGSTAGTAAAAGTSTGAVANVAANPVAAVHAAGSAAGAAGGVSGAAPGLTGAAQGVRDIVSGGVGPSASNGAAGAISGSAESAARLDSGSISEPHRTLVATPTTLEVGVPDGTQGWLRIRAEVGDQGQVNAALTGPTSASQEMLHRELPALNAYLHSEQMAVTATVSDRSLTGAAQGSLTDGSGRNSTADGMTHGGSAGGQAGGGQASGQTSGQADAGRQGTAASLDTASLSTVPQSDLPQRDATRGYDGNAGLSETALRSVAGSAVSGESGQWLNVSA